MDIRGSSARSSLSSQPDLGRIFAGDGGSSTISTLCGRFKRCSALRRREIAFLVVALTDIVGVVAFTIASMVDGVRSNAAKGAGTEDFTYSLAILLNVAFCTYYVISGVFREMVFEVVMLLLSQVTVLVYCIADAIATSNKGDVLSPIKIVRLSMLCVAVLVSFPLAVLVIRSFGYFDFRIAGASNELQRLYKRLTFFNSISIINLQLGLTVVILVLWQGVNLDLTEKITLGIGVPSIVLWTFAGILLARREHKVGMIIFEVVGLAAFAYIGWKASVVDRHNCFLHPTTTTGHIVTTMTTTTRTTTHQQSLGPVLSALVASDSNVTTTERSVSTTTAFYCFETVKLLAATAISMTLFLISHAITMVCGLVIVIYGFGKGLKEKLMQKDQNVIERLVDSSIAT